MKHKVISFYRYTAIENPAGLCSQLRLACQKLAILGRILVGTEGINGAVSGTTEMIHQFQQELKTELGFSDLSFREQDVARPAYHKLVVRVRAEICAFGAPVNPQNHGAFLTPTALKQWYDQKEDFVIVDARNEYEFNVGHFQNALKMPLQNFREFAEKAVPLLEPLKDKKIVLYCTGGIRCEKASAYLREQGFPTVYHVEGGVINYVNQFPDTYWKGGLFVFDDRLVADVGESITLCVHCQQSSSRGINCHNLACDRIFICCNDCGEKMAESCSHACKDAPRRRTSHVREERIIVGSVENYYSKPKIALVKFREPILAQNSTLTIEGKTTAPFTVMIKELWDEDGKQIDRTGENQFVTFPVEQKVRKNDLVLVVGKMAE